MELTDLLSLSPLEATKELLGWELLHITPEGVAGGIITETEAYLPDDPANHAFRGLTPRNAPMFLEAGHVYIYKSYGLHTILNIVLGPKGYAAAALIRSLEPTQGVELMKQRRGLEVTVPKLCSGPGNVGKALGVSLDQSGEKIGTAWQLRPPSSKKFSLQTTHRVGISQAKDSQYRFIISDWLTD